ncbi:MAG: nucleotidyltransferase family protein [Nitrospirota bacterium]|nr:nucleotidyltransferase family protein [Nitrospirota bacterium]
MKAMILAAGLGTRLRPLTETIPKPLLPVGGMPLIVWNLLLLRAGGIRDVIINLHYLGAMIEDALGDGSRWDMHLAYSHEPELLGTGGGVKAAEAFFEGKSFLVINGDTLIDIDVGAFQDFHASHGGVATLVVRDDPHAVQWGAVESEAQGRILRINGQGWDRWSSPSVAHTRMFAGVHILHPSLLANAPSGQPFSIIDSYTHALAEGSLLLGFVHAGYWSDIGTVERYSQAQADVEEGVLVRIL